MSDNKSNNLVVLSFDGMATAAVVYDQIEVMEKQGLLTITDAVILERSDNSGTGTVAPTPGGSGQATSAAPVDKGGDDRVRIVQKHGKQGKYAAGGGGIGMLAGWLLGGPVGGLVIGAGIGAVVGALKDFGIDDKSVEMIKSRLQPNSSALLVLGQVEDKDAFASKLRSFDPKVVSTTLSPEVEKELYDRLAES